MGDPIELSQEEQAKARLFAKEIVESVINDERFPLPLSGELANKVLGLAQVVLYQEQDIEDAFMAGAEWVDRMTSPDERVIFSGDAEKQFYAWLVARRA